MSHIAATAGGVKEATAIWQDITAVELGESYTLSYWTRRGASAAGLVARLGDWSLASVSECDPPRSRQ